VKTMRKLLTALFLIGSCSPALAVDFHFDGYADLRLIVPSNQESWQSGLLGKLRYGAEDNKPELRLAEAVGQALRESFAGPAKPREWSMNSKRPVRARALRSRRE